MSYQVRIIDVEDCEPGKHYLVAAEHKEGVKIVMKPAELVFVNEEGTIFPVEITE